MSLERAKTPSGRDFVGDVLVHEPFALRNVPRLRALCYKSALKVGLGEIRALMFVLAIDQSLVHAIWRGDGQPFLTVVRHGSDRLVARVAARGTGRRTSAMGSWQVVPWASRLVYQVTVRSDRRGTALRLVVVHARNDSERARRCSPPNGGHFTSMWGAPRSGL